MAASNSLRQPFPVLSRCAPLVVCVLMLCATVGVARAQMPEPQPAPARAAEPGPDAACANVATDPTRLGVSRVVEIDSSNGPILGKATRQPHAPSVLAPKEIILTFDDGPLPWVTRSILATLRHHCTRATFFSIGQMALAYPGVLREELAQGHSVGTHTWSHPLNLTHLAPSSALDQIERGAAAVTAAAGRPVSAFFRFPGLSDNAALVAHLAAQHVAAVTVDVITDDSFMNDPARLTRQTLARVEANHGGIILFHDIKPGTAKALPGILDALAARGYSVVHMVTRQPLAADPAMVAMFTPQVEKALLRERAVKPALVPFFGTVGPVKKPPVSKTSNRPIRSVHASWSTNVKTPQSN